MKDKQTPRRRGRLIYVGSGVCIAASVKLSSPPTELTMASPRDSKPGRISAWESQGRELVLYWRDLAPDAVVELPIDLICRVPGEYRGPASRGYLYYNADVKHWVEPLSVVIKPKAAN